MRTLRGRGWGFGIAVLVLSSPAAAIPRNVVPNSVDANATMKLSNGRTIKKADALAAIQGTEPVALRRGKQMQWQHLMQFFKMLEDSAHKPIASVPRRAPLRADTAPLLAQQRQTYAAEIVQMRQLEGSHWASVIERNKQFDPAFGTSRGPATPAPIGGVGNGSFRPMVPAGPPQPSRRPDEAFWSKTIGDPNAASLAFNVDFTNKGDSSSAGCEASLGTTATVMNQSADVFRAALSGKAKTGVPGATDSRHPIAGQMKGTVTGEFDVYVFGAQVFTKSGSFGGTNSPLTLGWQKAFSTPSVKIPVWAGIIYFETGAAFSASAGFKVANVPNAPESPPNTVAACAASFGPDANAKAQAFAEVSVDLPPPITSFLSTIGIHIEDLASAGVEGQVTLADIGVPMSGSIAILRKSTSAACEIPAAQPGDLFPWAKLPPGCTMAVNATTSPGASELVIAEGLGAQVRASFLAGELDAYVQIVNPCLSFGFGKVCLSDLLFDIDSALKSDLPLSDDQSHFRWQTTLFKWDGFKAPAFNLFSLDDSIAFR